MSKVAEEVKRVRDGQRLTRVNPSRNTTGRDIIKDGQRVITTPHVNIVVNYTQVSALLDTGSHVTLVSESLYERLGPSKPIITATQSKIGGPNHGSLLDVVGHTNVHLKIGDGRCVFREICYLDKIF